MAAPRHTLCSHLDQASDIVRLAPHRRHLSRRRHRTGQALAPAPPLPRRRLHRRPVVALHLEVQGAVGGVHCLDPVLRFRAAALAKQALCAQCSPAPGLQRLHGPHQQQRQRGEAPSGHSLAHTRREGVRLAAAGHGTDGGERRQLPWLLPRVVHQRRGKHGAGEGVRGLGICRGGRAEETAHRAGRRRWDGPPSGHCRQRLRVHRLPHRLAAVEGEHRLRQVKSCPQRRSQLRIRVRHSSCGGVLARAWRAQIARQRGS